MTQLLEKQSIERSLY